MLLLLWTGCAVEEVALHHLHAPFVGCTVEETLPALGLRFTETHDHNGYAVSGTMDEGIDGDVDQTWAATMEVWPNRRRRRMTWSNTAGSDGATDYDLFGWREQVTHSEDGRTLFENTYDTDDRLMFADWEQLTTGQTGHIEYDSCERVVVDQSIFGSIRSWAWEYQSGCTPRRSVSTSDDTHITTEFDAAGRPEQAFSDGDPTSVVTTWRWTCP
ncbi:MAG: hypothetical protein KTR31_03595 [Myxococcales bacterium]|nr:hypothetical protein [Myxococcales bacterium]